MNDAIQMLFFFFCMRVCKVFLVNNQFISNGLLIPTAILFTLYLFMFSFFERNVCPEYFMNRVEKALVIECDSIRGTRNPSCPDNYWAINYVLKMC